MGVSEDVPEAGSRYPRPMIVAPDARLYARAFALGFGFLIVVQFAYIFGLGRLVSYDWVGPVVALAVLAVFVLRKDLRETLFQPLFEPLERRSALWSTVKATLLSLCLVMLGTGIFILLPLYLVFESRMEALPDGATHQSVFMETLWTEAGPLLWVLYVSAMPTEGLNIMDTWGSIASSLLILPLPILSAIISTKCLYGALAHRRLRYSRIVMVSGLVYGFTYLAAGIVPGVFLGFLGGVVQAHLYFRTGQIRYVFLMFLGLTGISILLPVLLLAFVNLVAGGISVP